MKVKTRTTAKSVSGAAKGGASAIRDWIGSGSGVEDARRQASDSVSEAQKQVRKAAKEARREARRRATRARIAAARARAGTRSKASGVSSKAVGAAGAVGLAAGYFLDPDSGKRRRHTARDRTLAVIRRTRREAEHRTDQVEGKVEAAKSQARPEKPAANDQALAERVKSKIFQPEDAPKGSVNVNVENGVVYLRGEVKRPDQIRQLVEQAGAVDGVSAVENLLST